MAIYEYRCARCGVFEITRAMGSARRSHTCVHCGTEARRSFSVPHLNQPSTPLNRAIARAEKSRDEPEVVTRVPPQESRRPQPAAGR
ncbi:MAG: zinc ribbon domain-containing protein [Pseudonocardiaceae bacterium]|nr:zinc ribbon domain-containing protein [Pseudonocardiaceae bacterium]